MRARSCAVRRAPPVLSTADRSRSRADVVPPCEDADGGWRDGRSRLIGARCPSGPESMSSSAAASRPGWSGRGCSVAQCRHPRSVMWGSCSSLRHAPIRARSSKGSGSHPPSNEARRSSTGPRDSRARAVGFRCEVIAMSNDNIAVGTVSQFTKETKRRTSTCDTARRARDPKSPPVVALDCTSERGLPSPRSWEKWSASTTQITEDRCAFARARWGRSSSLSTSTTRGEVLWGREGRSGESAMCCGASSWHRFDKCDQMASDALRQLCGI